MSSKRRRMLSSEWATPLSLFKKLNEAYGFTLDACATRWNTKCPKFYDVQQDGLTQDWEGERVYCCPPSGAKNLRLWAEKCHAESRKPNTLVVGLFPVSTDSTWYQTHINLQPGVQVGFFDRRIVFENPNLSDWEVDDSLPKRERVSTRPSMLVVWRNSQEPFEIIKAPKFEPTTTRK